jgi:DNA-directed RNA polymerase specialized sigma24 family protein
MSTVQPSLSEERFADSLAQSHLGQSGALGELLELHRQTLLNLARRRIPKEIRGRLGDDDAVQMAFVRAVRHFEQFRGISWKQLRDIERLPRPYRCALRLRFDDHLGYAEIGAALGRSAEAARKMIARAVHATLDRLRVSGIVEPEIRAAG